MHTGSGEYRVRIRQQHKQIIGRSIEQINVGNIAFQLHICSHAAHVIGKPACQIRLIAIAALKHFDCII